MLRQDIIRLVQATILPYFIIATLAIAHRYRQPFPKAIGQSLGITLATDGTTVNLCLDPAHWQAIDKREAKPMPHPSGDTLFANGGLIKPVTEPVTITNGQLNLEPLGLQTVTPQPMLPPFSKCPTCRFLPTPIKRRHAPVHVGELAFQNLLTSAFTISIAGTTALVTTLITFQTFL